MEGGAIPREPIAVPVELLDFFPAEDNVVVIKKMPIEVRGSAGMRHNVVARFPLLPRGGVKVFPPRQEPSIELLPSEKVTAVRYLPYAKIYVVEHKFGDKRKYWVKGEGHLVFTPINDREMKVSRERPKYVLVPIRHRTASRSFHADVRIYSDVVWRDGPKWTATAIHSANVALLLIEVGRSLYYAVNNPPYRGGENMYEVYELRFSDRLERVRVFLGKTVNPDALVEGFVSFREDEIL